MRSKLKYITMIRKIFQPPNLVENTQASRIKCGNIFILSDDNFSLICELCEHDFYSFEDFRLHIKEHFPKSITNIKTEDPIHIDIDFESITPDLHYGATSNYLSNNEDFPQTPAEIDLEETNSDCESIPPEIHDEMMDFKDIINHATNSESFNEEFGSSKFNEETEETIEETIQSEQLKGQTPKLTPELQRNNGNDKPVPLRIIKIKVNEKHSKGLNHSRQLNNIKSGSIHDKPDTQTLHPKSGSLRK